MRTLELSGSIRREKRLQGEVERVGKERREGPGGEGAPSLHAEGSECTVVGTAGGMDSLLRSRERLCLWHPLELVENYPLLLFWGCLEGWDWGIPGYIGVIP